MKLEKFAGLEKEIDKLLQIIDTLQKGNGALKERCKDMINSHKKDQEVIKTLKNENMDRFNASKETKPDKTKEAQIREGLEKIVSKLDDLL